MGVWVLDQILPAEGNQDEHQEENYWKHLNFVHVQLLFRTGFSSAWGK